MNLFQPLAQSFTPSFQQIVIIFALGLVILAGIYLQRARRPRDGSPKQYRREIDSAVARSEEITTDLGELLAELDKWSKRINGQVEELQKQLQAATSEADKRISALRILIEAARAVQSNAVVRSARGGEVAEGAPTDERSNRIYQLADTGLTPLEIAQKLEQAVGEVELVLNLRKAAAG